MNVLEGKVSVVTGGRRGIGFGIVSRFLAEGASVIVADPGEAPEALRLLQAEHSGRLLHVRADVTDEEQVAALFTTVEERFSQLDVLVNNAGVEFYKPVTTTSLAEWNGLMDVNLGGVFLCCRQAMRLLEATRGTSSTSRPSWRWWASGTSRGLLRLQGRDPLPDTSHGGGPRRLGDPREQPLSWPDRDRPAA
jgi:NAD(P)-dependent dehydrogenase (short-subunit alcohol dehydrogenase family)